MTRAELTWEDIKQLIITIDDVFHEHPHDDLVAMTEKAYCEEILARFNETK